VNLDRSVEFRIKLDNFFVDYFYVLVPLFWLVTYLFALAIRSFFKAPRRLRRAGRSTVEGSTSPS
jgi:hypothetical protein